MRHERCDWLCSGYLYVTNVLASDDRLGFKYVCIANNPVLGAHVQGQDQRVEPRLVQGTGTGIGQTYFTFELIAAGV